MAENNIPIQIEVRPPSRSDVDGVVRTFAEIKQRVEAQGRDIGKGQKYAVFNKSDLDVNLANFKQYTNSIVSIQRQMEKELAKQDVFKNAGIKSPQAIQQELDYLRQAKKLWEDAGKSTEGYNGALAKINSKINVLTEGNARARGEIHKFIASMASLSFEITGAVYGLTSLAAFFAGPAIFGIKFSKDMEDAKLGISSIIASIGQINGKSVELPQALGIANSVTKDLAQNAAKYAVSIDSLLEAFRVTLAPGLSSGMNIKEIEQLATVGTVAVRALGLPAQQVAQELRDLAQGGIQPASSTLATALGLKDSDIKAAKASAQGLFAFLMERLQGFDAAAKERQNTLSGIFDTLKYKVTQLFVSEEGFSQLKEALKSISEYIGKLDINGKLVLNPALVEQVNSYWTVLKEIGKTLGSIFSFIGKVFEILSPLFTLMDKMFPLLEKIAATFLIMKSVEFTFAGLEKLSPLLLDNTKKVSLLQTALTDVSKTPYTINIGVAIAGYEAGYWLGEQLNKIEGFPERVSRALEPAFKLVQNFGQNLVATFLDAVATAINFSVPILGNQIAKVISSQADAVRKSAEAGPKQSASGKITILGTGQTVEDYNKDQLSAKSFSSKAADDFYKLASGDKSHIAMKEEFNKKMLDLDNQYLAASRDAARKYSTATNVQDQKKALDELTKLNKTYREAQTEAQKTFNESLRDKKGGRKLQVEENTIEKLTNRQTTLNTSVQQYTKGIKDSIEERQFELSLAGKRSDEVEVLKAQHATQKEVNKVTADYDMLLIKIQQSEALTSKQKDRLTEQVKQQKQINIDAIESVGKAQEDFVIKKFEETSSAAYGAQQAWNEYANGGTTAAEQIKKAFTGVFKATEDALVEFVKTGKISFGSLIDSMLNDLIRMAAHQATKSFFDMIGTSFGGSGGTESFFGKLGSSIMGLFSAHGNAFDASGHVSKYAQGGMFTNSIVSQPTMFAFAQGGALGMMGEAGPEAIMPLSRTSGGDLGVRVMGGGNVQVNVAVNIDNAGNASVNTTGNQDMSQMGDLIGNKVKAVILEEQRPGGLLNRSR